MQEELAYALTNPGAGGRSHSRQIATLTGVRRLTPRECERLMGWPDDHTRWTADGREIADTNRYKLCGNGVVSTVAEYIGHRLVHVDRNNHG
jgi:DNA (cytosine-5)-methyltransferase 1